MSQSTIAALVASARLQVENLSSEEMLRELTADNAVLVDLREPEERAATGSIPGAIAVPRGMLEFRADPSSPYHLPDFDPAERVILFCASGGRSALGVLALKQLGYRNVAHLAGGLNAWMAEGHPTVPVAN